MLGPVRASLATRVFTAFAAVLLAFGGVMFASIVQHQRTATSLRVLHEGYLRAALAVGEARATQAVLDTMLDRVLEETDTNATRRWVNSARLTRPASVKRALAALEHSESLASSEEEFLLGLRSELDRALAGFAFSDQHFDRLFAALGRDDRSAATALVEALLRNERDTQRRLRSAWELIDNQVRRASEAATADQEQATAVLILLSLGALGMGLLATLWSQRILAPLRKLQERVAAVARGDLHARALETHTRDEVGRLATEFERMVEALNARDARLLQAERLAAIGQMAAHVTHEVRNPLSSISLNVEMLEDELEGAGEEARALLAAVHTEIDRLTAITHEYLRLGRLPDPSLEPLELPELVRQVVDFLRPELEALGLELRFVTAAEVPSVAADDQQLRQALINLIRNAREATQSGAVEVEVDAATDGAVLRVLDRGCGIPSEQREKIFDLFFTTKKRGSGLGLPLTQQIVLAHGGRIVCEARDGGGTRFEIWLPRRSERREAPKETP